MVLFILKFIPYQMAKDLKEAVININPFNIEKVLLKKFMKVKICVE